MTDKMILMQIPLSISGNSVLPSNVKANFGRDGHGCIVVDRIYALQLEHTYPKHYRALEIPEELVLKTQSVPVVAPVVPPTAKPVTNPAAKPAGRKSSAKGK